MHSTSHWLKPLVFMACLLPGLGVLHRTLAGTLGVNPVESLHHTFGDWTLRFLILTLLITPLRLIPGWNGLTRLRRMLGLYAFFYASLHVGVYLVLDQQFDWPEIWADITKRPFITLGISAYLLMIPLALTSTVASMQRMGIYWQRLHQLIYLVTALGILHFFLLVKVDVREPWFYAVIFALLLILRIALAGRKVHK
jgi:sulfoxide reductase heme-binding subunit YedZ